MTARTSVKTEIRCTRSRCILLALILAFSSATSIPAQTPDEALFQAVEINAMHAVEAAISAGADLAAKNANVMTPADVAVDLGHFRIEHVLLAKRTANVSSAPRVTDKGKKALITPRARVAAKRPRQTTPAPARPDPKLSDLLSPKKPVPASRPGPPSRGLRQDNCAAQEDWFSQKIQTRSRLLLVAACKIEFVGLTGY